MDTKEAQALIVDAANELIRQILDLFDGKPPLVIDLAMRRAQVYVDVVILGEDVQRAYKGVAAQRAEASEEKADAESENPDADR